MDKKKILEDIVENHLTVKIAADKYDCSVSTIRKYIASLSHSDNEELIELYNSYCDIARENERKGRNNGSHNGKRKTSKTMDEIKFYYDLVIMKNYTLRELEAFTKVPRSTLYELFVNNLSEKELMILNEIFQKHRRNGKNDYENDTENSANFHEVGSYLSRNFTRR